MTAFEAPLATEAPNDIPAPPLRRRAMVAVMAFLAAIAAVAVVSTNSHVSFPDRSVLACGDAPGLCPPPDPSSTASNPPAPKPPVSDPHGAANTLL